MRTAAFLLLCMLLLVSLAAAHSIETKFVIKSDKGYNIKFSTDPQFPLAHRTTHLDAEIWDDAGKAVSDADLEFEIREGSKKETLAMRYAHGHYEGEYISDEAEAYTITPLVDGEPLAMGFAVEVDSFGASGLLRAGIILLLLIVLACIAYHDCRKRKIGKGDRR